MKNVVFIFVFSILCCVRCLEEKQLTKAEKLKLAKEYMDKLSKEDDSWIDPHDMFASQKLRPQNLEEPLAIEEILPAISSQTLDETVETTSKFNVIEKESPPISKDPTKVISNNEGNIIAKETQNVKFGAEKISETLEASASKPTESKRRLRKSQGYLESTVGKEDAFTVLEKNTCFASDYVFLSRWLRRFSKKMKEITGPTRFVTITITEDQLTTIETILGKPSPSMTDIESIILEIISGATFHSNETSSIFSLFSNLILDDKMKFVLFISLLFVWIILICNFIPYSKWTIFVLVVLIAIGTQWMQMYQEALANKASLLTEMDYPSVCKKADMGIYDSMQIYFKSFFFDSGSCSDYYKAIMVDPFWEVNLMKAVSLAFSKFALAPLGVLGEALNIFVKTLLKDLTIFQSLVIIFLITWFVFVYFKYTGKTCAPQSVISYNNYLTLPSWLHKALYNKKPNEVTPELPAKCPPVISCSKENTKTECLTIPGENSSSTTHCTALEEKLDENESQLIHVSNMEMLESMFENVLLEQKDCLESQFSDKLAENHKEEDNDLTAAHNNKENFCESNDLITFDDDDKENFCESLYHTDNFYED